MSRNTAQWFQTAAQEGLTVVEHTLHHLDSKRIGADLSAQHELERVHRHLAEFRQSYQSDFEAANEAWDLLTTALSTLVIQFGDGSEELDEHQNDLENLTMDYLGTNHARSGPMDEYGDDEGDGGREPNGRSRYGERADLDRVLGNPERFIREFKSAHGRNLKTLEAVLGSALEYANSAVNFSYDLELNDPGIGTRKREQREKVQTIAALCRGVLSAEQAIRAFTTPQTVPEPLPAPPDVFDRFKQRMAAAFPETEPVPEPITAPKTAPPVASELPVSESAPAATIPSLFNRKAFEEASAICNLPLEDAERRLAKSPFTVAELTEALTDQNHHTERLIIEALTTPVEVRSRLWRRAVAILIDHREFGNLTPGLQTNRNELQEDINRALSEPVPVKPVDVVDAVDAVDAPLHSIAESESTTVAPSGSSFADQVWADRGAAWRTAFDAAPAEGRATMLAHLESERQAFKAFVQNGPPFPNAMEEFYKDRNLTELAAHAHAVLNRDKTPVDSVDNIDKQPEAGLVPRLDASLAKRERLMQLLVSLLQQAPPEVDRQFVLDAMGPVIDALLQTQFAAASSSSVATPQALEAAAQTAKAHSTRKGLTFWASQETVGWTEASGLPRAFRQAHPAYKIVSMAWSTGDTDTMALRPVVIHPNINGQFWVENDEKWVASDVGTGMNIAKASTAREAESRARQLLKAVPNALGRALDATPVLDWPTLEEMMSNYHYDAEVGQRYDAVTGQQVESDG